MRYAITSAQLSHLRKEGQLEFEKLYSELKIGPIRELVVQTPSESGRDLHRITPLLFSALNPSMLGQVAYQLFGKRRIKLAFSQRLPAFESAISLSELSSISETLGGSAIDLETGNVLFFLPETSLDFPHFSSHLLLVFCTDRARYVIQKQDPQGHWLKDLGYASGDRLTETTHPLIHK